MDFGKRGLNNRRRGFRVWIFHIPLVVTFNHPSVNTAIWRCLRNVGVVSFFSGAFRSLMWVDRFGTSLECIDMKLKAIREGHDRGPAPNSYIIDGSLVHSHYRPRHAWTLPKGGDRENGG